MLVTFLDEIFAFAQPTHFCDIVKNIASVNLRTKD